MTSNLLRRIDQMLSSQGDGTGVIAQNLDGRTVSAATTATPTVVTCTTHAVSVGDIVFIDGVTGITEVNGLMRVLTAPTVDTLTLEDLDGNQIGSAGTFGGTADLNPVFNVEPSSTEDYLLDRLNVAVGDASAWVVGGMLGLAALTNGIIVAVYRGATLRKTITSTPVKGWHDWAMIAGSDVATTIDVAGGNKHEAVVRATFSKPEQPIHLDGSQGDILVMYTQDDLAALTTLQAGVQGENLNVAPGKTTVTVGDSNLLT